MTGNRDRNAKPSSTPIIKGLFLERAKIIAKVRKRTATTCSMYHDEPTEEMNQKHVPKPKRAANHSALLLFAPIFFNINQVAATQRPARNIDISPWSKLVPKSTTKGKRRTAGIGG